MHAPFKVGGTASGPLSVCAVVGTTASCRAPKAATRAETENMGFDTGLQPLNAMHSTINIEHKSVKAPVLQNNCTTVGVLGCAGNAIQRNTRHPPVHDSGGIGRAKRGRSEGWWGKKEKQKQMATQVTRQVNKDSSSQQKCLGRCNQWASPQFVDYTVSIFSKTHLFKNGKIRNYRCLSLPC